jgi:hypothetical protein
MAFGVPMSVLQVAEYGGLRGSPTFTEQPQEPALTHCPDWHC